MRRARMHYAVDALLMCYEQDASRLSQRTHFLSAWRRMVAASIPQTICAKRHAGHWPATIADTQLSLPTSEDAVSMPAAPRARHASTARRRARHVDFMTCAHSRDTAASRRAHVLSAALAADERATMPSSPCRRFCDKRHNEDDAPGRQRAARHQRPRRKPLHGFTAHAAVTAQAAPAFPRL